MTTEFPPAFARQYESHLKHLKLKGLQPKTIDAYSRAIRRLGGYFDYRIDALSHMSKEQLKATYKAQLRQPRDENGTGAGLGLIDMSRKSFVPLTASLTPVNECRCFFSLRATI